MVNARWEDDSEFAFGFDFADLGEQITNQVNEGIARFASHIETRFGPDFGEKVAQKAARKAEEAARKAERAAERAQQRAERQAERQSMRQTGSYGRPSAPPPPPRPRASADEQIKILKMVEQGIISPDEAATLLEAIER